MTKANLQKIVGASLAFIAALPYRALAQFGDAKSKLETTAGDQGAGYNVGDTTGDTLLTMVGGIIKVGIGLTGIIFLGLTIYAGFKWMTASGDTKAVDESKRVLTQAVIGLIIIVLAYAITSFVFSYLGNAGGGTDESQYMVH